MAAYVISEVEMLDETQGRRYRELAAGSIARHGGRYLVRGAAPVVAEGNWPASARVVIVEFPSMDGYCAWGEPLFRWVVSHASGAGEPPRRCWVSRGAGGADRRRRPAPGVLVSRPG
jgi:uncharacterized protein (DUF1330 family)